MSGDTMLAIAVALVLYGLYLLGRDSLAEVRGTPPPPRRRWSRVLLQPHRLERFGDAPLASSRRRPLLAAQHGLRDDIARSPLDTIARRRLMSELEAWIRARHGNGAGEAEALSVIRARFEHDVARAVPAASIDDGDIAGPFDPVPGKDDLRAIQGIGKRMQRLLNGMGVTTFAQLAAFERSHIERVAARLEGDRDDIEAENWVGQARALLARRRRTHEEGW